MSGMSPEWSPCRECGGPTTAPRFTLCARCNLSAIKKREQRERAERAARTVSAALMTWRCRDHPDQAVRRTALGYAKGCPRCARGEGEGS